MTEIDATARNSQTLLLIDIGSAPSQIELACHIENAITHRLGLHAMRRHAPEEFVVAVECGISFVTGGGHTVGIAGNNQPVHGLHAPLLLHELSREPIQQSGMRRLAAIATEIENAWDN